MNSMKRNHQFNFLLKRLAFFMLTAFIIVVIGASLRGFAGNPNAFELNVATWKEDGPFELSPERGRFALTYSLVEDQSFFFSVPLARFVLPDLGYKNGHYVSLFAPAVSFLVVPGFVVGRILGTSQVGTYAVIALFALFNMLIVRAIAIRLGAHPIAATIGSFVFLFASPAFAYAVTLYQHHISTFLILLSVYVLLRYKNLWSLLAIWFLCAASIPVDYPNLFLMVPIAVYASGRMLLFKSNKENSSLQLRIGGIFTFIAVLFPLAFFLWFNQMSYGNPLQFSGTVPGVGEIDAAGLPTAPQNANISDLEKYFNPELQEKSAAAFFKARNIVNGLYIEFISPDRGILVYTPVVLLGIAGMFFLYRRNRPFTVVLIGIIGANILLYSMWGDPWGGWAFGSRYLIPSYAILSIFLAIVLTALRKKTVFLLLFLLVFSYSAMVNTAGALSSNANPPQTQVLALEKLSGIQQKYTFERNLDFLKNSSKSFVYQTWAKSYVSSWQYFEILSGALIFVTLVLTLILRFTKKEGSL